MKYEVLLYRSETRTEIVECDTPEEAIIRARGRCHESFRADEATEILEDGEPGKTHEIAAICENCNKWLWMGEPYESDEDGINLCPECAAALRESD